VLEYLAGGMSEDQILADFPDLVRDDIRRLPVVRGSARATAGDRSRVKGRPSNALPVR